MSSDRQPSSESNVNVVSRNMDKALELENALFTQLASLLEEVATSSMNVIAGEDTDLSKLATRRLVVVRQLQEILTSTPLPDPLLQPVESQISIPQYLGELSREREELKAAYRNVEANKENLTTLLENARKRDENLLEIIAGMKKETEAIEDDDPAEELRNMVQMKKRMMRAFNTILEVSYPDLKTDVKNILEALFSWDSSEPYMPVPDSVQVPAVLLLAQANIIEFDDDLQKIKCLLPMSSFSLP